MENTNSESEKKKKASIIGKAIAKTIGQEEWSVGKITLVSAALLLPFGVLGVATYFGAKEYFKRKKNNGRETE